MFDISVCILDNTTVGRYWHATGATAQTVGLQLTLACDTDYWLPNSTAGNPVTTQIITCESNGVWSDAENCNLIRKCKSIFLTLFFETLQPGLS